MPTEVALVPTGDRTYSVSFPVAPAATATDLVTIAGVDAFVPVNGAVEVKRIRIGGVATAAGAMSLYIIKRTAPNTGGTATNPAGVLRNGPYSPAVGGEAAKAVVNNYSANPAALGATTAPRGGTIMNVTVPLGATGGGGVSDTVITFETDRTSPPELYSSNDVLAISNAGAAVPAGAALQVTIDWIER